ncbi:hypothetical protein [Pseudoxanthomonas winnipegensis]|uniref:hypothetical protein n=1 Tax=Pseudoxanthomonas winnipegensis TaxID=2480810 RepID=UPI0013EEFB5A|nr:hypothetical protein [Pseudoxanthomonas winnipegensis]
MPEPERRYFRDEVDVWTVICEERQAAGWREVRRFWPVPLDPDTAIPPAELRGLVIEEA